MLKEKGSGTKKIAKKPNVGKSSLDMLKKVNEKGISPGGKPS